MPGKQASSSAAQEAGLARGAATRRRLREAAIGVLRERGLAAELRDFLFAGEVAQSTFYRHFETVHQLIQEVAEEMVERVQRQSLELIALDDSRVVLLGWWRCGFEMIERYGRFAVQLCDREDIPPYLASTVPTEELYRFTGWIVKQGQKQGYLRPDLEPRAVVRTFFTLVHPSHIRWALQDGLSYAEIEKETLLFFLRSVATPGAFAEITGE